MTYVDDLLAIGQDNFGVQIRKHVANIWKCSDIEILDKETDVSFLGMKITLRAQGIFLHQQHYTMELLNKYECSKVSPANTILGSDEGFLGATVLEQSKAATNYPLILREAQKRCGELLWLATRTRPDMCYTAQQKCTRELGEPSRVVRMARRVYRWLRHTVDTGSLFPSTEELERRVTDQDCPGVPSHWTEPLLTYTDASFAPHIMEVTPEAYENGEEDVLDEYGQKAHADVHRARSIRSVCGRHGLARLVENRAAASCHPLNG